MNKKSIALAVLFLSMSIFVLFAAYTDDRNACFSVTGDEVDVLIRLSTCIETIRPYYNEKDGVYYYFLPSVIYGNRIYNDSKDADILINGEKMRGYSWLEWSDDVTYSLLFGENERNIRFKRSSDVAAIFISTDTGSLEELDADKSHSETGKIVVIEKNGMISYSGGLTMKGRGNSTFRSFSKKPYNMKLDNAAGILGMDADKDFCLLANSWDYSYMNNKLALDMAQKAGLRYVPKAEYADVWFNGAYWGLYLVTEKNEVGENKIDITDLEEENERANPGTDITVAETFDYGSKRGVKLANLPDDITGGYLIERDYRLNPEYPNRVYTTSYFETEGRKCINIKSPKYAAEEEVDYIRSLVNDMEQTIMSDDGYSENGKYYLDYIDLDSWVKCYMIAEIAYDPDKDVTNTYYYKDRDSINSKFYSGPVWDYDCRFGGTTQNSYPDILTKLALGGWDHYLYDKDEFYDEIKKDWNSLFEGYLRTDAPENIDMWQELIRESVEMDNVRWNRNEGYSKAWPGADNSENFITTYVFDDQVDHLRNWVEERRVFLDGCWGN